MYNSTKYKDEKQCFLLCEQGGVMICVLNESLNKIDYYLYLNEYDCIKSTQLNNGDILCLTNEYQLLIYKQNILEKFLKDLFKTFDDYMNQIYLSTNKYKPHFNDNYNNEDIIYIDDSNNNSNSEINEFPNYDKIFGNITIFNFIEKINNKGEIILILYGNNKEKFSGYKNKYYLYYSNITNNSNAEEIIYYEKSKNYLLIHYNNVEIGYNYIKKGKNGIGIFNIINKQIIICCEIDDNILDFKWNSNNHLILCFNQNEKTLDDHKIRYFIQEIDMQKKTIIGCRNLFNSEEAFYNNIILLIDEENDNIFYVFPDKFHLSLLK